MRNQSAAFIIFPRGGWRLSESIAIWRMKSGSRDENVNKRISSIALSLSLSPPSLPPSLSLSLCP